MAKVKTLFICQSCGANSPKWIGRCPACNEWNTYVEEVLDSGDKKPYQWDAGNGDGSKKTNRPKKLGEIDRSGTTRIVTSDNEFNRVLGGGIVLGSMILIGGEPGIGKSTLLLQVALALKDITILYVSGEESDQQIKLRAERIAKTDNDIFILTETQTQKIFQHTRELQPQLIIVDSIQTLYSDFIDATPGSVSQIRECTGELQRFAKETNTPVILVGHINKEGAIAGPKLLEHIVDTVLQFEGDQNYNYRILRTVKNRFGSTSELGIYEMQGNGLRQVSNPSEILMSEREEALSGIAIAAMIEGMRPMLIEVQALVTPAVYGTSQRSPTGFDLRRLHMLLAVLEKRGGFNLGMKDVFLNIAGGIKVDDPAIDLAIVAALISSLEDTVLPVKACFAGEVGLSGEIRAVNRIEQRISEAEKLGFEEIFVSKSNMKGLNISNYKIKVIALNKVEELYQLLF